MERQDLKRSRSEYEEPTSQATPVIETRYENRVVHNFKAPQVLARLVLLIGLLARPDVVLSSIHSPTGLENEWYKDLGVIKRKVRAGRGTPQDCQVYTDYGGFYYQEILGRVATMLTGRVYQVAFEVPEIGCIIINSETRKLICRFCEVIHQTGPAQCTSMRIHGPRFIHLIKHYPDWNKDIEGIVVGTSELLMLPAALKRNFLNLGVNTFPAYFVPASVEETETLLTVPFTLYAYLKEIVTLMGSDSTLPIYVEFFTNKNSTQSLFWHCVGFLFTLKAVQKLYHGPIVALVSTLSPNADTTLPLYIQQKKTLDTLQKWFIQLV